MRRETGFNEIIRKVRKELFGKGPERIHTTFVDNMAITMLYGNLTPSEKFLAQEESGKEMVHAARTKMVQKYIPHTSIKNWRITWIPGCCTSFRY